MGRKQRQTVHVLVIEHKYGNDVYAGRTREIARWELDRYGKRWWKQEMEEPMPKSRERRIEEYFSAMGDRGEEFYTIRETKILENRMRNQNR